MSGFPRDPLDPRKRVNPTNARNKGPILEVLQKHLALRLPAGGKLGVLEVASGTGEHAAHFAAALPATEWQPTEWRGHASPGKERQDLGDALRSIAAWTEGLANVRPPVALDAAAPVWPVEAGALRFGAVSVANLAHIAPLAVVRGLFAGAARVLEPGGVLFLYGPFAQAGVELGEGNAAFDERLRRLDSQWGLRDVGQMEALAAGAGLVLVAAEPMPANNLTLVFSRPAGKL